MIHDIQSKISRDWLSLIEAIQERDSKLEAAGDIHRFNRDVADAMSRIAEKTAIVSSQDIGKDLKGVQSLIRNSVAINIILI